MSVLDQGREYHKLNEKFRKALNPESGNPGWLISTNWLDKYKIHVQYESISNNFAPKQQDEA